MKRTRLIIFAWLALAAISVTATLAQTNHTTIPFGEIGAAAREHCTGDGLSTVQSAEGASLRCVFQKLEGHVNTRGLWLTSSAGPSNSAPFRVVAQSLGREHGMSLPLAGTGEVEALSGRVRFHRPGLDEEYSVSVDGIRQDLIVTARPAGNGALQVNLAVDGARAEALADGARLVLDGSGRKLAYNHLKVTDAHGRQLTTRMQVVSPGDLAVVVDDADAAYPVRIDPTFSDANWLSLGSVGLPGANGTLISATVVGTYGDVYVGGQFTIIGSAIATNIAKWNGSTWSALGSGMNGGVFSLACDRSGNLYAGGNFTTAGGMSATNIAKWNGSTWSALGSGMNGEVQSLACDISGNLYAGGNFTTAGGVTANCIAKWNGSMWSALGSGIYDPGLYDEVESLACDRSGNLYAGGGFSTAGGVTANNIAKWNGNSWSRLGSGMNGVVDSLACDSAGNLYAGGHFTTAAGVSATNIAEWNGSAWTPVGSGINDYGFDIVFALTCDSSGNIYAGGGFTSAGGVSATNIAKWNGSFWCALGSGIYDAQSPDVVTTLACDDSGNLYAGGAFQTAGGVSADNIAKWNGSAWSALGIASPITGQVNALACDHFGNLYLEENVNVGGANYSLIAEWNGSSWFASPVGFGDPIYALVCDSSGNLYSGGDFGSPGPIPNFISEWNGSTWSALGSGMNNEVYALACEATGNLYAGGSFTTAGSVTANHIAKWNGTAWSALGSGTGGIVYSLACDNSGNLYAGGDFGAAKWNGTNWSSLGSAINGEVYALTCDGSGNLYAGGDFGTVGGISGIAEWNGNTWSALGSGMDGPVLSLTCDNSGNLYAGGAFSTAGGVSANNIAKWNGNLWSALGSGMNGSDSVGYTDQGANYFGTTVNALVLDGYGSLYAGGDFYTAGTNVAFYVAEALLTGTSSKPPPGSLQTMIAPADAVNAGAEWQVDGGKWQNSGAIVSNLSVGPHAVTFSTISGWTTPHYQKISVIANSITTAIGTYLQFTFTTNNGTLTITGYTGSGGAATIPSTIYGLPVTSIGEDAFYNNTSLTSVTIPNSVTSIGAAAFNYCSRLTNVIIGDSVTNIGNEAFANCSALTSVTIPNRVTSLGDYAFYGCTAMTSVTIGNSVTSIGEEAFYECVRLTNVTIPGSVTSIGGGAFEACIELAEVTIPSSVTNIGDYAFDSCYLTSVTIPNSVTSIGTNAFYNCYAMTNVTIGKSVTSIGNGAFGAYFLSSLRRVYCLGNAPTANATVFENNNNATLYYLPGTTGWGSPFAGCPAVLWNPRIQTGSASFGVQNNQFGFDITYTNNVSFVVEACTNLAKPVWVPLMTNSLTNGSFHFSEPFQPSTSARYYGLGLP